MTKMRMDGLMNNYEENLVQTLHSNKLYTFPFIT